MSMSIRKYTEYLKKSSIETTNLKSSLIDASNPKSKIKAQSPKKVKFRKNQPESLITELIQEHENEQINSAVKPKLSSEVSINEEKNNDKEKIKDSMRKTLERFRILNQEAKDERLRTLTEEKHKLFNNVSGNADKENIGSNSNFDSQSFKMNTSSAYFCSMNKKDKQSYSVKHGLYHDFSIQGSFNNYAKFNELLLKDKKSKKNFPIVYNNITGVSYTKYYTKDS